MVVTLAIAAVSVKAPAADAQTACPASGSLGSPTVTITNPGAGPVAANFVVSGQATSAVLPLSRATLLVGGSAVASQSFAASTSIRFSFSVGPSQISAGNRSLSVLACGDAGLISGSSPTVIVAVATPVATSLTTAPTAAPGTTAATSAATSTTATPGPTTTVARTTTTREALKKAPDPPSPRDDKADVAALSAPAGLSTPRPLTISAEPDRSGSPRRSPWVGPVVVVSGGGTIALASALRPRRGRPLTGNRL